MNIIKKLDGFVLRNYLMLFAGTFCISLFVVMMQFLWKYVDELIGKGLELSVMAKFFFYAAETLVSLALPLAILLASLISFGNMGERLELLAMKAAGIPLIRILRPLFFLNLAFAGASFYFQDVVAPQAQQNLMQLLYSMRQKSPELDIPEGVFYDGVEGMNLYVREKNRQTGMLYDVIIYNMRDGVNDAHIILSDSARLESTSDKMHLLLHLYNGEQFENLRSGALKANNVPYRRETFVEKHFVIDFDSNFQMSDAELFSSSATTKNMVQLMEGVDSIKGLCDSVGVSNYKEIRRTSLYVPHVDDDIEQQFSKLGTPQSPTKVSYQPKATAKEDATQHFDTIFNSQSQAQRLNAVRLARQRAQMLKLDIDFKGAAMEENEGQIRRHWIQFWQKITMSLACLVFFFVGAPLGAIIRKGGLGMPVVISVVIFIVYYIINTGGMKLGREGSIPVWVGMWMSTVVLAPMGVFFTVKSNNDSVVFNKDAYVAFFRKMFGIRTKRYITRKEVVIEDPDYHANIKLVQQLLPMCREEIKQHRRMGHPLGYLWYIVKRPDEQHAIQIQQMVEQLVRMLSNSKDRSLLLLLNGLPVMQPDNFRFYRRRRSDMRAVMKYGDKILQRMNELVGNTVAVAENADAGIDAAEAVADNAETSNDNSDTVANSAETVADNAETKTDE